MLNRQIRFVCHILQRLQWIVGINQLQQHSRSRWWNTIQHFGQIDQEQHSVIGFERLKAPIDGFRFDNDTFLVELMSLLGQTEA